MLNLAPASAQDHFHVTIDAPAEFGVIILSEREGWRFQAGGDMRWALHHLGSITGEVTSDETLGEIFGRFCIGK